MIDTYFMRCLDGAIFSVGMVAREEAPAIAGVYCIATWPSTAPAIQPPIRFALAGSVIAVHADM